MNAGFSSLALLKSNVLATTKQSDTTWDAAITQIGLGVAGLLEKFCSRKFARVVGDTWVCDSTATAFVLPRYPVETLTSIEVRERITDPWISQTLADCVLQLDAQAGVVQLATVLGSIRTQLRWTWTGGYWWDTTENASGTLPGGAAAIPEDIRFAWLLQVAHVWARKDRLGLGLAQGPDAASKLGDLEIIPAVRKAMEPYRRYA